MQKIFIFNSKYFGFRPLKGYKEVSGKGIKAVSDIPTSVVTKMLQKYSLQAMHINELQRYIVKL